MVCLGATAAQALLGKSFKATQRRGELMQNPGQPVMVATVNPSSILRAPDDEARPMEMLKFVDDLKKVAALLG